LHEDEALIVLNKPHRCRARGGRFYRNTLRHILSLVITAAAISGSPRDATPRDVLVTRTRIRRTLQPQFARGTVENFLAACGPAAEDVSVAMRPSARIR